MAPECVRPRAQQRLPEAVRLLKASPCERCCARSAARAGRSNAACRAHSDRNRCMNPA